jgi:DNA (cytosine-5)-methyltransferase 1
VELGQSKIPNLKAHFLAVKHIAQHAVTGEVILRGLQLDRNTSTGMISNQLNEVSMMFEEDLDDSRPLPEQCMIECRLDEVVKIRAVKYTHLDFPQVSFRSHTYLDKDTMSQDEYRTQRRYVRDNCELVCRNVVITQFRNAQDRKANRKVETTLRRLVDGENPTISSIPQATVREQWSRLLTTYRPSLRPTPTYNTGFAGAGGDACGASEAGFAIPAAFDHDEAACRTFQLNFPQTVSYVHAAHDMIRLEDDAIPFASVWHLSCPCQTWSSAHTNPGKNDDANSAQLFTVMHMLRKTKPTVITLEQTAGIVGRHAAYFATLINQVVCCGYNVRWTIVNFKAYGLPSSRNRLIVFGAK